MPATATSYDVRFTEADDWLTEVARDFADGQVLRNLVRLATREGAVTVAMIEPDRAFDDRVSPACRGQYLEAAYQKADGQLVKLSRFVGWTWKHPDCPERREHNERTMERLSTQARRVQAALAQLTGLEVRGGALYVEEGPWTAHPEESIRAVPEILCRFCDEAIHFANQAWRHTRTNNPAFTVDESCGTCNGTGRSRAGGLCIACQGKKTMAVAEHYAEPADVEEGAKA